MANRRRRGKRRETRCSSTSTYLGYRKPNRADSRRRGYGGPHHDEPGRIDGLLEVTAVMIISAARVIRWLWRMTVGRPRSTPPMPPPPVFPSYIPSIAPQPLPPQAAPTFQARVPARNQADAVPHQALPYRRAAGLLTKGERAVWHPLYRAVKGKYRLFCKVRLADIVCCPRERRDERRWFRKISRFHVDFVVCDPDSTAPLLVVELDDRRHLAPQRQEIDAFKDAALRAAGVPVYRIAAQHAYDPIDLAENIERLICIGRTPRPATGSDLDGYND